MAPIKLTERAIESSRIKVQQKLNGMGYHSDSTLMARAATDFRKASRQASDTDLHFRQIWNKQLLDVVDRDLRFVQGSMVVGRR